MNSVTIPRAQIRMALTALENDCDWTTRESAAAFLRAHLAQHVPLTDEPELQGGGYSKVQLEQLINGRLDAMRPVPLTDAQIEEVRQRIFSTGNPYCPVDNQAMRKVSRAIEATHGIGEAK